MDGATVEIPQYVSHKKVWALKIKAVADSGTDTTTDENPIVTVSFEKPEYAPQTINLRGKPTPEAGWYFVMYEDGYISFSPAKAFEEGYTLVRMNGKRPTIAELDAILNSEEDTPITINPDGSISAHGK